MKRLAAIVVLTALCAVLGSGVVHLVRVDGQGDVRLAPRIDEDALRWWTGRAHDAIDCARRTSEPVPRTQR